MNGTNKLLRAAFLLAPVLALCAPAMAQEEPMVITSPKSGVKQSTTKAPPERPALDSGSANGASAPAAAGKKGPGDGTTIVGERESPIGLYITPWKSSFAEKDIDRPARLLQEDLLPIDQDVFDRNVEYYDALSGALKAKKVVTPPMELK